MTNQPEILIKSFNRPYYLDRCLYSIFKYCKNFSSVKVLDDGTPKKYLDKIKEKYPSVLIKTSEQYEEKNKAIQENLEYGKEIDGFQIPVKLWKDAVKESTEIFIITEDDVWFTREVNLLELSELMRLNHTALIKLGNLGVKREGIKKVYEKENIIFQTFKLRTLPKPLMIAFFENKFKFFSILYRLKLADNNSFLKYFDLFSILMGMYSKDYWLKIWENIGEKVDERKQMLNSAIYYRANKKNKNLIALLENEAMKTTFKSSATNSYHKYGYDFDVNRFNFIMNELWYQDELDINENFPKDFSDDYIIKILNKANHPKASSEEWKKWSAQFRKQYQSLGCVVD